MLFKTTIRRLIPVLLLISAVLVSLRAQGFAQNPITSDASRRNVGLEKQTQQNNDFQSLVRTDSEDASKTTHGLVKITGSRSRLEIVERLSKIVELPKKIVRVDGFDPEVLDVSAMSQFQIRVQAVIQGVTNLRLTDVEDNVYTIEVFVKGDVRHLQAVIENRFPDSAVEAYKVQDSVALTGWVSQPEHITQIVEIAEQFYPKVLNQMRVGGVQQVKLKVKIMEVQRSKLRRMGFDFISAGESGFLSSTPADLFGIDSLTLGPSGVSYELASSSLSNASTAFGFVNDPGTFQGFFDALRAEELLKILAEPVLVTTNGRPAMMLSGGEFPVLVPQTLGVVSIEWRDFGVRLEAVPIILGDGRVRMEIMPEVSERDFANSVNINGTTVPALTTRRVNTQVEMRFGQTLMLAGLISSRQTSQTSKIPFLGELPWAGTFFRKVQYEDVETELVILLTPELVAPLSPEQVPHGGPGTFTTFPTDRELFLDGFMEVPNYGDECAHCGNLGTCGPNCFSSGTAASGPANRFAAPIQEEVRPAPIPENSQQFGRKPETGQQIGAMPPIRAFEGITPLDGPETVSSSRRPVEAVRPISKTPTRPTQIRQVQGRARQVGFVKPAAATDGLSVPQINQSADRTKGPSPRTTTRRIRRTELPGLIEP